MSRDFVVTRRKRMPKIRAQSQPPGTSPRVYPTNPGMAIEVPYEGAPVFEIPEGKQISISNRSGDRKKI